jgi:DNA polymerase sigma
VDAFGSYASDLSTFSSDVDVCVYGMCGRHPVKTLEEFLYRQSWCVQDDGVCLMKQFAAAVE